MNFGQALEELKKGNCVTRTEYVMWNILIFLRKGRLIKNVDKDSPMLKGVNVTEFESMDHLCLRDSSGACVVGWMPTLPDLLAEDWEVVN